MNTVIIYKLKSFAKLFKKNFLKRYFNFLIYVIMKKIINGKIYNTKNAIKLVCVSNNLWYSDFRNLTEGLFITKKWNFFV